MSEIIQQITAVAERLLVDLGDGRWGVVQVTVVKPTESDPAMLLACSPGYSDVLACAEAIQIGSARPLPDPENLNAALFAP